MKTKKIYQTQVFLAKVSDDAIAYEVKPGERADYIAISQEGGDDERVLLLSPEQAWLVAAELLWLESTKIRWWWSALDRRVGR